jgi:hypothetical protein
MTEEESEGQWRIVKDSGEEKDEEGLEDSEGQ